MRLIFIAAARLYPPADRTLWFTGSVHSDDSQFFATPELTRTCRKVFAPPILSDWRGTSLLAYAVRTTFGQEPLRSAVSPGPRKRKSGSRQPFRSSPQRVFHTDRLLDPNHNIAAL